VAAPFVAAGEIVSVVVDVRAIQRAVAGGRKRRGSGGILRPLLAELPGRRIDETAENFDYRGKGGAVEQGGGATGLPRHDRRLYWTSASMNLNGKLNWPSGVVQLALNTSFVAFLLLVQVYSITP